MRKVDNFYLKAKYLKINSEASLLRMRCLIILLFLLGSRFSFAQVERPINAPANPIPVKGDTVKNPLKLPKADTLQVKLKPDSIPATPKGDIETTIFYSAEDSINSSLDRKIIHLYGKAKITYGQIELQAEEIVIDYTNSTISANGKLDSTGRRYGFPLFKDGGQEYETRDMVYNIKTKKAKISEVVTKQGDGFLHGDLVYKNEKNELFSMGNAYTTCDLVHPHFRVIAKRTKAIPGDKMVTGPFYMEFNDVATPLGFLFGIFPSQRKSASGIIVPAYGEEGRRGFFLRRGGYFFDISEYMKLSITGDLYSKGSSAVNVTSTYNKKYAYTGSFNFSYTNNVTQDRIEVRNKSQDFILTWSHSPQSKGTGRFSASVNAATATFNNNNFLGINNNFQSTRVDQVTRKLTSNVSYSKTFPNTPFTLGVNLRHNQDLGTRQLDLPMPDVSFNMNNVYPFKSAMNSQVLQNFNLRYTMNGTNQITNNLGRIGKSTTTDSIAPFNLQNLPVFFQNSKRGIRHSVPINTSFKLFKFFTLSPSISFDELWYFEKLTWGQKTLGAAPVVVDTVRGFNRVTNYSGGVGINTRIYGTYIFKNKNSRVKAIRHIINPAANINFSPNFADPGFGYFQNFDVVDQAGNKLVYQKSRHEGFIYGSSRSGESATVGLSINNNLEMKVKSAKDTVEKKVAIFNSLAIATNYNLLADSFKLSLVSLSANTNVLDNKINLNFGATLDPYEFRSVVSGVENNVQRFTERRFDKLVWSDAKLGRITQANMAFSTNLNPKGRDKDQEIRDKVGKSNAPEADKQMILQNPDVYVDFSIPWNARISYNIDYLRNINQKKPTITQALRLSGDVSLTEKWKIGYNTGYDFQQKEITQTQFTISRELHCWQMSLQWTPFGRFQSYFFSLGVKSSLLRDLKLDRTRNFNDN